MDRKTVKEYFRLILDSQKEDIDNGLFVYDKYIRYVHQASLGNFQYAEHLMNDHMSAELSHWLMEESNYSSLAVYNYLMNIERWFSKNDFWVYTRYTNIRKENLHLYDIIYERMDLDGSDLILFCENIGIAYLFMNDSRGSELLKLNYYMWPSSRYWVNIEYAYLIKKWKPNKELMLEIREVVYSRPEGDRIIYNNDYD